MYALCILADYLLLQPFVFAKDCQKGLGVSVRYLTFQTLDFLQDPSTGGSAAITQYYHLQLQNTNGKHSVKERLHKMVHTTCGVVWTAESTLCRCEHRGCLSRRQPEDKVMPSLCACVEERDIIITHTHA